MSCPSYLKTILCALLLMSGPTVWACEPCIRQYDLDASFAAADFVLIVEKTRDGPRTDQGYGWGGPDWIEVAVKETLKGRELPSHIKVNSFDGQCVLGFDLEKGRDYVILVKELRSSTKRYRFTSVYKGCGVKALEVDGDYILIDGGRWTFDEVRGMMTNP